MSEDKNKSKPRNKKAKKDFIIHQNDIHIEIKKYDDISEIPKCFYENLKTEKVI